MTSKDQRPPLVGAVAAAWAEDRSKRTVRNTLQPTHATAKGPASRAVALSNRDVAKRFNISASSVQRARKAIREGKPDGRSVNRVGRPKKISKSEEDAISLYITMMARGASPVNKLMVRDAINELIARRTPPGTPISDSAMTLFWRNHPEFHLAQARPGSVPGSIETKSVAKRAK